MVFMIWAIDFLFIGGATERDGVRSDFEVPKTMRKASVMFQCLDLDLDWNKYLEIDPRYFRPTAVNQLLGDPENYNKKTA